MRADLEPSGFAICQSDAIELRRPAATMHLATTASTVKVSLELTDRLTHKELKREVDLSGMPGDAQPLAVALGANELLRASWAELELRAVPVDEHSDHEEMERAKTATRDQRSTQPAVGSLAAGPAAELFAGDLKQAGVDARLSFWLGAPNRLYLRGGARTALRRSTADGAIQADAWLLSLGYSRTLLGEGGSTRLSVLADLAALRCSFQGTARGDATATHRHGTAWLGSVGVNGSIGLWRSLWLELLVAGGLSLNGVEATDGRESVMGATGPFAATGVLLDVPY